MGEPWRPLLELLESFADLLALARQTTAGQATVDSGAVEAAVERFRDAKVAASEIELHSVRIYQRNRGGFIARVVPRPHSGRCASHSDEATHLTSEQLARMVGLTGEYFLGDPWELEPERVASHWGETADELASLEIPADSLSRLMALVQEEHLAAPTVQRVLPMVYREPKGTDPGRRRAETRARRAGYRIDAAPAGPEETGERSPTDQLFFVAGEPAERSVTKVAGLPYRAAGLPWPLTDDGRPRTFLAQFGFDASRDLVGKRPGDVLLIFAEDREAYLPNAYDSSLRFEWYPLGLRDLIRAEEIPEVEWKLRPYFGVLYRTDDEHLVGTPGVRPRSAASRPGSNPTTRRAGGSSASSVAGGGCPHIGIAGASKRDPGRVRS